MKIDDKKLREILLSENYVTEEEIQKFAEKAEETQTPIVEYLIKEEIISETLLAQAIAESFGVAYADLNLKQPTKEEALQVPEDFAKEHRIVFYEADENSMTFTTDDPSQEGLFEKLSELFPEKEIKIAYSLAGDIEQVFVLYQKSLETRFSKIIEEQNRIAPEILEEIFLDAYTFNASDIHFEPGPENVLIRFRVDGVLQDAGNIPKEYYENILNRIKVQSRLRIDEHFAAQDGSMRFEEKEQGVAFDLRTSIVPTVEGEKVVLRVLSAYIEGLELDNLGFTEENKALITEASKKPFGMILVAGPTGSGKTTTLYGVLKVLNSRDINITTIEDPVEYKVLGINQIQTNTDTGLSFAKGLRSIVRQDPDVILVGEIRDEETAEIAVNAALTGHLMLSTFHANDAATSIPRLLDMKIEPFLLASTLEVIVAQRLVRKICDACRYSVSLSAEKMKSEYKHASKYFKGKKTTLYRGKGCASCAGTGYRGRTAIFEFIKVSQEMEELILKSPSTAEIWRLAEKQGSKSMFEDGVTKVNQGVTSLEELLRVVPPKEN